MRGLILIVFLIPCTVRSSASPPSRNYDFRYSVDHAPTGNHYYHKASSSAGVVQGEYSVLLADGRTQHVAYTADDHGYTAHVTYDPESTDSSHSNFVLLSKGTTPKQKQKELPQVQQKHQQKVLNIPNTNPPSNKPNQSTQTKNINVPEHGNISHDEYIHEDSQTGIKLNDLLNHYIPTSDISLSLLVRKPHGAT